jgi:hypothetical protein
MKRPVFSVMRFMAWKYMRKRKTFTLEQLREHLEVSDRTAGMFVECLRKHEYLAIERDKRNGQARGEFEFRLVKDTGAAVPQTMGDKIWDPNLAGPIPAARQRIWNALRNTHAQAPIGDLMLRADVGRQYCSRYLRKLEDYGYLRVDGRPSCYYLLKDTGPFCPVPIDGEVFDQNLGKYMEIEEDASADS